MNRVKIGLIGTGFVADLHAAAAATVPEVEVVAVASPAPVAGELNPSLKR